MMEARCKHGRQTKTTRKKRKRNTLKMASGNTVDLPRLAQLKHNMEEIAKQRKNTKSQLDEVEQRSAEMMLKMNIRFIDESGSGAGPFWTLCKDKKEGNWKTDRYMEFFTLMLTKMNSGERYTAEQLTTTAQAYLKQFEKRGLKIEKHTQTRQKGCEDLRVWLAGGGEN